MTAKKATSTETRGNAGCSTQPDGWIKRRPASSRRRWRAPPLDEDFRASFVGYFRLSASPADTFSEVVVVPGKYQRQLPAEVTVTWVVSFPASPVVTVLTVL